MSNCSASCTSVRSPLIAAIATFALKADEWFRRGLLLMLSPDSRANLARCQAEAPLIALCRFPKPALCIGHDSLKTRLTNRAFVSCYDVIENRRLLRRGGPLHTLPLSPASAGLSFCGRDSASVCL